MPYTHSPDDGGQLAFIFVFVHAVDVAREGDGAEASQRRVPRRDADFHLGAGSAIAAPSKRVGSF